MDLMNSIDLKVLYGMARTVVKELRIGCDHRSTYSAETSCILNFGLALISVYIQYQWCPRFDL